MNQPLQCSESYCNIHDIGLSTSDYDVPFLNYKSNRPIRNPWDGFCLRLKALKSLSNNDNDRSATALEGIKDLLLNLLDTYEETPPSYRPNPVPPTTMRALPPPPPVKPQWQEGSKLGWDK
jgi:hypothetical protein